MIFYVNCLLTLKLILKTVPNSKHFDNVSYDDFEQRELYINMNYI